MAELSGLSVALVANDHIQQDDTGLFAFDPIGHPVKVLAAMIASHRIRI